MNIEQALTAEFQSISGLSKKVFPSIVPEGVEVPYLVYELNDVVRFMTQTQFDGLIEASFTIAVYNFTASLARDLIDAVLVKVKSFLFKTIGTNGPFVQNVQIDNEITTFDYESRKFLSQIDITISYKEA